MQTKTKTNPYLSGNFAPVASETQTADLKVRGVIPEELNGRLVRIGPNPINPPDPGKYHWFMGNGMVHGIDIRDGKATTYRNRYVVDSTVARAMNKEIIGGPNRNLGHSANTNVIRIAGKTYAVVEAGGLPVELDDDLQSVQRSDFGNTLKNGFAAHHRVDPATGELHTIAYEPGQKHVSYIVVDKSGRAKVAKEIKLPHSAMIHDMAITASSVIVLDLPVSFALSMIISGKTFPFKWNPKVPARVGLISRADVNAEVEWFDVPTSFVFHVLNAFDRGSEVIIDVVKHPKMFDKHMNGPYEGATSLVRWTINRDTKKVSETLLCENEIEFPRINENYTGSDYRYGYTCQFEKGYTFGSAYKHDVIVKTTLEHNFGKNMMSGEPVFVSKAGTDSNSPEDAGWVMCCVFNGYTEKSEMHIIDAENFTGTQAIIEIPARIPFGFHGNWFAAQ